MTTEPTIPIADLEVFCQGLDHAEGITVTPAGTIYVGGEAGQVYRVEDDGTPTQVHTTNGFLLGLASDADGAVYAVDVAVPCVWRIDLEAGNQDRFFDGLGIGRRCRRTGARSTPTAATTCPTPAAGAIATG